MKSIAEILGLTILFITGLLLFYFLFFVTFIGDAVPYWDSIKQYLVVAITLFVPLSAISYTLFRRKIRQKQIRFSLSEFGLDDKEIGDLIDIYGHDTSLTSHRENIKPETEDDKQDNSLTAFARLLLAVLLAMAMAFLGLSVLFYGDELTFQGDRETEFSSLFLGGMKALNIELTQGVAPDPSSSTTDSSDNDSQKSQSSTTAAPTQETSLLPTQLKNYQRGALLMFGMAALGAIMWGYQHIVQRYMQFDICPGVYYGYVLVSCCRHYTYGETSN